MKTLLRQDKSYPATIAILFILSVISIVSTVILGEFVLPLAIAFYAALITFEKNTHILSFICALIGFATLLIPVSIPAIWGSVAVICGFSLFFLFRSGNAKSDSAIILTLLISAAIVLSFVVVAYKFTDEFSLESTVKYFSGLFEELKIYLIDAFSAMKASVSEQVGEFASPDQIEGFPISEEALSDGLTLMFNMIVSFIVVIAFLIVGLAIKLFTFIVRKNTDQNSSIHSWKFSVPSLYAYLFLIVFLLSSFVSPFENFGIVIINLSNIFTFVFAYIGFKAFKDLLTKKGKRVLGILLPILGVVFLGSVVLDVLSAFGAVSTIISNKKLNENGDVGENKN